MSRGLFMFNNKNQIGSQPNNEGIIINLQLINSTVYLTTNYKNSKEDTLEFQDAIKNKIVDIICNNSNQKANDKNKEGVKYFINKNYKEALKCFKEAIEIDTSIPEIHYNLGNTKLFLYSENENIKNADDLEKIFDDVRKDYSKAISLSINKPDFRYYYNRGTLYAFSKKYNMAIDDLSKSIDVDNTHPEAYINRANTYLILRDNDNQNLEEYLKKASEDLKKAEELSNEDDKYLTCVLYNNLGNTYLSNGDFYNAEKYYKKSLEKDNNYIYAILGLANIDVYKYEYYKENDYYMEALNKFNDAEKINPNFHGIYYNKSHLLLNKGRTEGNKESYLEAIKLVNKALECLNNRQMKDNITKALYYYGMGVAYSELYNYDKSVVNKVIESYKKSIELNEGDYNPYYNLASFYDNIGNKEESINYYNKSININPNHESSYNNKAAILMEKGIYDEAILDLNNVIRINNNNAGAYYNLGVIYSCQGKYQLAIDNFNKCINLSEGNNYFQKISYYNLGIIVGRMGNNEEAVRNLIRAYEIEDNTIDNKKILKTIKEEAEIYNNQVAINYLADNNRRINY